MMIPTKTMTTRKATEIFSRINRITSRICSVSESYCGCTRARGTSIRWFASEGTTNNEDEPFYGKPMQAIAAMPGSHDQREMHSVIGRSATNSIGNRIAIAIHNATTAFADPTRADAVAALGEVTGPITLRRIHDQMMGDPTGRLILQERPIVTKVNIPYDMLIAEAPDDIDSASDDLTFGQVYGAFLKGHDFDPDERDEVNFIEDETLAYIMLRYRQNHDFFHALTGLPPTVLGELGLKWLELFQTGLPIAALSCTVGSLRLDNEERQILQGSYLPWAVKHMNANRNIDRSITDRNSSCFLMNVYYEKEFDTPIKELRKRLNLVAAPSFHK